MALPTLKSIFNTNQITAITNLIKNFIPRFNPSNAASALNTVTINATSGIATFTMGVAPLQTEYVTINNTYFKAAQKINPELAFQGSDGGGAGNLILCGYDPSDGQYSFAIYNSDPDIGTGAPFTISFQIT